MDPITQIFQQAQAPTGKWDGPINAYLQGKQLAQHNRQLNLQEAMAPLEMESRRLSNQETALDIDLKMLAKQRELDVKKGQSELMKLIVESKNTPDGILGTAPGAMEIARKYGAAVFVTPLGQTWLNNYRGVQAMQEGMTRAKAEGLKPYSSTVTEGGKSSVIYRNPALSGMGVAPREAKLAALYNQAVEDGDEHMIEVYKAALDSEMLKQKNATTRIEQSKVRNIRENTKLQQSLTEHGYSATQNEDGTVTLTPVARPPTTATTTRLQESFQNWGNMDAALARAEQAVASTPEAFGPLGGVRQGLEVARSILFPGEEALITGARQTANESAIEVERGLRTSARGSVFEEKQLAPLAKITGRLDTPDIARKKLEILRVAGAGKAIREAKELHLPPPMAAQNYLNQHADLAGYTEDELVNAVNDGYISRERGLQEFRSRKKGE